ncbi:NADH oxidase [Gordonia spumicola]|uniref:NADH oxidase n=1 Tax=Gordonia spumicola TaxID=589161 RepID=A0A7I9V9K7_9ACTN|nr:NADH:flavin oxidoreductase [Gordonia spumicola]GEE00756.1 NADH oxidase [Gordonia spumicola]GEE00767.1 NADH oxidase [Gordonia spumicola]GEE01771.1 NADH oxidase [Gordonia spumicola]
MITPATPLQIGQMVVDGRLYKSATSETRASDDGFVTNDLLDFYRPMITAGTPLIVTGSLFVSRQGKSAGRQAGIDDDDKIAGLAQWAELAHSGRTKLIAQLNHGGRQIAKALPGERIVSASNIREPLYGSKPVPLRRDEIPAVVQSFAEAARRAVEAGMDGVQIHAAHGYLLSQFLTPHTNRRNDDYGGPLDNRARLLLEVLGAVRASVGDSYPILVKLNGTDDLPLRRAADTGELLQVARWLQDDGADAIEISRGHYESWPGMVQGNYRGFLVNSVTRGPLASSSRLRKSMIFAASPVVERVAGRLRPPVEGFNLGHAAEVAEALTIPVICVGGFHSKEGIGHAVGSGMVDAVSAARAFIADPFLYRNVVSTPNEHRPVCGYCNLCIASFSTTRIDCGSPDIRTLRDVMIRQDAGEPTATPD